MAIYYVWSGATGAANGTSWTDAYVSLATALTGKADGDIILVAHDHTQTFATGGTISSGFRLRVACVNRSTGALATTAVVNVGASNSSLSISGHMHIYGIQFQSGTSTTSPITINAATTPFELTLENCLLESRSSSVNTSGQIQFGTTSATVYSGYIRLINTNFKTAFGTHTMAVNFIGGRISIVGGSWLATTVKPDYAFSLFKNAYVTIDGFDFSVMPTPDYLVAEVNNANSVVKLHRCKLPSGAHTPTYVVASSEIYFLDCSSGSSTLAYAYYNAYGSIVNDTGVKLTAGLGQSWKITTTAAAGQSTPFISPAIEMRNSLSSSVTPYIEVLQTSSATALTDDQVWAEFLAKVTGSSVLPTIYSDRQSFTNAVAGSTTAQATGAGTGAWTGAGGTAWSGKLDSGAALTPTSEGYLSARVYMTKPDSTLYVDPVIRV